MLNPILGNLQVVHAFLGWLWPNCRLSQYSYLRIRTDKAELLSFTTFVATRMNCHLLDTVTS